MSRRRTKKRQMSKYENDAVIVTAKISKIDCLNVEAGNGKYKTVFYCPSYYAPEGRMCVYWKYTGIKEGDEVYMQGRFSDGIFLVWSLQILKKNRAGQIGCIQN